MAFLNQEPEATRLRAFSNFLRLEVLNFAGWSSNTFQTFSLRVCVCAELPGRLYCAVASCCPPLGPPRPSRFIHWPIQLIPSHSIPLHPTFITSFSKRCTNRDLCAAPTPPFLHQRPFPVF